MPLNKLQAFIKSADGRILYVNPSDINATDSITNDGTSLTQPFVSIQRALIESARYSFLAGVDNDLVEKTTILLFPGEYIVDNRPGWGIRNDGGTAKAFPPSGSLGINDPTALSALSLELDSNFDLTQENNILYRFNSIYGGVIIPRGISIVGLDLRKTKIRPKYVPNPTDPAVKKSALFRITGACYFWQFSMFDADETGLVYTHPSDFSVEKQSIPLFSHHKLTCFEYADGVNEIGEYGLTDLDMYYSKLSNAYNAYRSIPISSKYPANGKAFAKRDPEWQIVGAFATDPIIIESIISGDGSTADNKVTVTTVKEHNLNAGSPIKIRGVSSPTYNISTKVAEVDPDNPRKFTYFLPSFPINLPASPAASGAIVTVETDTVSGASPYIFNCSLRSVWGMNGMLADGAKASGFRSMVVAQFTAVSLQKDDRAFVKYDPITRTYNGVNPINPIYGADLPTGASQTDTTKVYHLDQDAIYRKDWESSHIKIANDAFIQIVSVFAIGFNKHFDIESGGDASITNSNSNFGQISLNSDGFKVEAFDKDNNAFITSIIPPRDIVNVEENIEWLSIDVGLTTTAAAGAATTTRLYLYGLNAEDNLPISITQGYRIGARVNDRLYLSINDVEYSADIYMQDEVTSSFKVYDVTNVSNSILTLGTHTLQTGEKIIINSETGDLPENVIPHIVYYAIRVNSTQIKLASSLTNSLNNEAITIYRGTELKVYSRVSDKNSGDIGSPIQYDKNRNNWYINVNNSNTIYPQIKSLGVAGLSETTDLTYVKRIVDDRSLDEKLYKIRVVIPKEAKAAKDPQTGFVIQESSSTGVGNTSEFTTPTITNLDVNFNKNQRFISTCSLSSNTVTVLTELPHGLNVNDVVTIRDVTDSSNVTGEYNRGYNGRFKVSALGDSSGNYKDTIFSYTTTDVSGLQHTPGPVSTNNTDSRTINLPRFERTDLQSNLYIYRNEVISSYLEGAQDGIYHLYVLNADNPVTEHFTSLKYSQSPVDLYPQLDRDNPQSNPPAAKTFALRSPIGDVNTSDLKKSITRETIDKALSSFGVGLAITSFSGSTISFDRNHSLSRVVDGTIGGSGGSGYTNGIYYNVKLFSNSALTIWNGATAKVTVSDSKVTSVEIVSGGSWYSASTLYFDTSRIGSGTGATFIVPSSGISTSIGDVVQITGNGSSNDGYFRINSVPSTNQIAIARTSGDPVPVPGQYAFIIGPSSRIASTVYNSTVGITTFTTSTPHGLLAGNKFRVINSSNNNSGDFVVNERVGVNTFTAITNLSLSVTNGFILKHGLSANEGISDAREENFATRQVSIYGNEYVRLTSALTNDESATDVAFSWISTGIGTDIRFPLGSYIQIDNELMRIRSKGSINSFTVIRGVLGTRKETHEVGSLIRRVNPIAVEFRRPSILRASGHTFEYLGYGPGNYSTGLPQIQVKSLSEREDFLVQAQERSCGAVVYTGMNNNGDFFSGNTKTSSVSGEVTSYDIPNPTVTGQDPSKSSAVFDEVTIKERLLEEGGDSGTVLSQFDGPVTFNEQTRFKNTSTFSGNVRITNNTSSDSTGKGALTVKGGVGIAENLNVGNNLRVTGTTQFDNDVTFGNTTSDNVTFTSRVDSNLNPSADNTYDLGSNSLRWKTINVAEIIGKVTGNSDSASQISVGSTSANNNYFLTFVDSNNSPRANELLYTDSGLSYNPFTNELTFGGGNILLSAGKSVRWEANSDYAFIRFNSTSDSSPPSQLEIAVGDNGESTTVADNIVINQYNVAGNIQRTLKLLDIDGNTVIPGSLSSPLLRNTGFDFVLGNGNQTDRGNSGNSRALVKDSGSTLVLNYGGDFTGGVRVDSYLRTTDYIDATTPATSGTTGGVRIRANTNNPSLAYLQFISNDGNSQYGYFTSKSDGNLSWSGSLDIYGKGYINKNRHASGANAYHLELVAPDGGSSGGEVSLRMHQTNRWWGQIRLRSDGFHFTDGADNTYKNIFAGTLTGNVAGNATTATTATFLNSANSSSTADNITTRVNSGFWQTSTATTGEGWPTTTNDWYHLISATHSNETNYYSLQLAAPFYTQNLYYRSTSGNGSTAWQQVVTSSNISTFVNSGTGGSANQILYKNSSGSITGSNNLTYNGSSLNIVSNTYVTDNSGNSVQLNPGGAIEIVRTAGPFIDFKNSSTDDFDVRIENYTSQYGLVIRSANSAASLSVEGDIIAFVSDERLKTNIKPIENALDKTLSLSGFTFNFNETAQSLGFDGNTPCVGVSAQEVQKVLPEAVKPAPIDENYITVQYEKLVPLLIEAVKELSNKVDSLETKLNQINNK